MIKIPYPKKAVALAAFKDKFITALTSKLGGLTGLQNALGQVDNIHGAPLTWEYLVTAPFTELFQLNEELKKVALLSQVHKTELEQLDTYGVLQSKIASFFMAQTDVVLASCYYCNIDSIFSFSELGGFKDGLDFLNRASKHELTFYPGIKAARAQKLIRLRSVRLFKTIADSLLPIPVQTALASFDPESTHNHFTLDHFYHKSEFPYLSVCLFNLVPSCYVCNSKFKGVGKLYDTDANYSSPSSAAYSFYRDVRFKVFAHDKKIKIRSVTDFSVELHFTKNKPSHEAFISLLKLRGRYAFYKKEVLRLLDLKVQYPETRIAEMAKAVKMPVDVIRKQVYGPDLFDSGYSEASLVKYKRDIAKNVKLIS